MAVNGPAESNSAAALGYGYLQVLTSTEMGARDSARGDSPSLFVFTVAASFVFTTACHGFHNTNSFVSDVACHGFHNTNTVLVSWMSAQKYKTFSEDNQAGEWQRHVSPSVILERLSLGLCVAWLCWRRACVLRRGPRASAKWGSAAATSTLVVVAASTRSARRD